MTMAIKRATFVSLIALLLAACGGGSPIVRVEASDRVMVQLPTDNFPRDITVWQETASGKSVAYFEGSLGDRLPRDGHIILPRDFVLFDYVKTGPLFDPMRFPKGRYTVNFFINAEHGYEKDFEIP
ncbi:MAG: hypothetical protein ACKOQM_12975 [Novosphingobium sp.]